MVVYRRRRTGGNSIEELYRTTARELRRRIDVIEYEMGPASELLRDVRRLRQLQANIYHIPGDVNYLVALLPRGRTVLTIHDIGHYLFGLHGLKRWIYKWLWLLLPIYRAAAVTSTSHATRRNIAQQLGIGEESVTVIPGCHSKIFKPAPRQSDSDRPTILQVGTSDYKNVHRLAEAIAGLRCRLMLIGTVPADLKTKLEELRVEYSNASGISHAEVYQHYVAADVVSFVSTGEGFGVPILEAQAVGRPVITSNIPPMCDVAGDGACLVDPLNVADIRAGIQRILADERYKQKLVALGFENVRNYSPEGVAARYLDLYRRLTGAAA